MNYSTRPQIVLNQQHSTLQLSESTGDTAPKEIKNYCTGL